ncbi:hypothetical protein BGY98DRAFT_1180189 [Russula aff. rugulosa BPL654]|nr:hypothetical protein BGY98DRAFT_1180189 [Russula aff. rugulosa BPL654]
MRGESEDLMGQSRKGSSTSTLRSYGFLISHFNFVDHYIKGPTSRCTTLYMTTPTTVGRTYESQTTIGPHARVHIAEPIRRWVPVDDVGDAYGDDTLVVPAFNWLWFEKTCRFTKTRINPPIIHVVQLPGYPVNASVAGVQIDSSGVLAVYETKLLDDDAKVRDCVILDAFNTIRIRWLIPTAVGGLHPTQAEVEVTMCVAA